MAGGDRLFALGQFCGCNARVRDALEPPRQSDHEIALGVNLKNIGIFCGLAGLAFAAAAYTASPTQATAAAPSKLVYQVMRNGDPVGQHSLTFARNGDMTDVDISTRVAVKMAFITVYRFEHDGHETWRGNRLVALTSQTNDDGTRHQLKVATEGESLRIAADGKHMTAPANILPASMWRPGVVQQSELVNTLDGKRMQVSARDMGQDTVKAAGHSTKAHHYKISGNIDRDVWFGPGDMLVRMQFAAKDGSTIVYELQ